MSKPEDHLADAIDGLTAELAAQRAECQRNLVTKQDLSEAERRITAAMMDRILDADLRSLDKIEKRIARLAVRVRRLDEQT
jgi:hypothetical protein